MQLENSQHLAKQLDFLKMRVELIAWRIEELGGMTPSIRAALPAATVDVFETLLYSQGCTDRERLGRFELAVRAAEEALAQEAGFWRSGNETLH